MTFFRSYFRGKGNYFYRRVCLWLWDTFLYTSTRRWAIRVSYHQFRERLDTYLRRYWPDKTKGEFRECIQRGLIKVNFFRVKPDYRVRKGDIITIPAAIIAPLRMHPTASPEPVKILYEDRFLIIVQKPVGLIVHHHFFLDQVSVLSDLLAHEYILMSPLLDLTSNVVHRLDKYTSGVLMVSRNYKYTQEFQEIFRKRQIYKEYRVLAHGRLAKPRGVISSPIRKDEHRYPSRMVVDHSYHKPAFTEYELISHHRNFSYCKVHLHTGRTHQIRVHFASLGHPIVGDLKYGHKNMREQVTTENQQHDDDLEQRMMLHAFRLQFMHPFTGQLIDVCAPLPPEFSSFSTLDTTRKTL
ncbi:RluA family pseudouridine synthase [candidate division CSSED10-310 bacterium]|uniref:Pseudouridine synthase n=1 Tax=candidate division CSSED10-310 bacterium TaxID=2855610 RepID=A0ABV6YRF9_UNCC1